MIYDLFFRHCLSTWTEETNNPEFESVSTCPRCKKTIQPYLTLGYKVVA